MDKLKPCPFCGKQTAVLIKHEVVDKDRILYYVWHDCWRGIKPIQTHLQDTPDDAIAEWNRRSGGDSCD